MGDSCSKMDPRQQQQRRRRSNNNNEQQQQQLQQSNDDGDDAANRHNTNNNSNSISINKNNDAFEVIGPTMVRESTFPPPPPRRAAAGHGDDDDENDSGGDDRDHSGSYEDEHTDDHTDEDDDDDDMGTSNDNNNNNKSKRRRKGMGQKIPSLLFRVASRRTPASPTRASNYSHVRVAATQNLQEAASERSRQTEVPLGVVGLRNLGKYVKIYYDVESNSRKSLPSPVLLLVVCPQTPRKLRSLATHRRTGGCRLRSDKNLTVLLFPPNENQHVLYEFEPAVPVGDDPADGLLPGVRLPLRD